MEAIIEKIENNICSVCFEKGEQEKISGDKGHTLLKCTKCDVRVHLRCYGEKNPHFKKSTAKTTEEDFFECEKCLNKETNCGCLICNAKDGYMVRLDPKKYVHIICALFTDYFEIVDFQKMKIEAKIPLKDIEKINAVVNNKNRCDICLSSHGVLLECECEIIEQTSQCGHKVHFYCALRDRFIKLSNDSDATDYWQIDWKFNYKGSFCDDNMDVYNTALISKRNEVETEIEGGNKSNSINTSSGVVVAEDASITAANDKKKSKAAAKPKKPSKATSGKKSNIAEDMTGTLTISAANRKIAENNLRKNSSNEETHMINSLNSKFSKTIEKNWVLKNRGGEIKVLCEDHREDVTYCVCRKSSGSEFMICCDNCEAWFHGRCLGFSTKEINSLKKWYCSFCTEWINNRNNYLLKEANEDMNEDLINQAKGKSWKMPVIHNHLQYKVIDLLFISILYWRKAEVLLKYPCTSEILAKHISLCYEIPFNLSRQILNLKRKEQKYSKLNLEIENFFKGSFNNISFGELDLVQVHEINKKDDDHKMITEDENNRDNRIKTVEGNELLEYGNLKIELNSENYKRVQAYYEDLSKLCSQTHDTEEGIINENFAFLEKMLKKLKWAMTVYEVIAQSGTQSSLQEVKSVCVSYTDLFSLTNSSYLSAVSTASASANAPSNIPAVKQPDNSVLPSQPFHKEFSLLTKYMTDYSNWQKSTKEMLSSHMKQKGDAEKILQEIESKIKKDELTLTHQEAKENCANYLPAKLNLIEKQKEKMKINLATKIPIEKIKEIIKIGRNLKINASKEIESIDSCLGEAVEWDCAFGKLKNQNSLKIEEIQKLIQSCTNILVCTPLMYQAVEFFTEFEIFNANIQNFLYNEKISQINYLPQLINNFENKFHIFKDEFFVKKMESLFKIRDKILKIQDHVKDYLMNNNDIKILKKLKESIEKEHKIFLKEEIEKLDQKIFYLNNIENLLNQKNDMKSLELIERLVEEYNINAPKDCNIKEKINLKKEKISEIKSKILDILRITEIHPSTNTNDIDLKYTKLKNIKEEIATNSILLEEEEIVDDSIKIIEWYNCASLKFKNLLEMDSEDINKILVSIEESSLYLDYLNEAISFFEKKKKNSEIILNFPIIKLFYDILQFFVWIIKADRMIKLLDEENSPLEKDKIEISELNALLSFVNSNPQSSLSARYLEFYNSRLILLQNLSLRLNLWLENYKLLELSIFTEGVRDFDLSSKLLITLQNDKIISERINLNSKANLGEAKTILKVVEKLMGVLESSNQPMEERPDKEKVLHTLKECEAKLYEQKIKSPLLRQFYHYGEISKELEKFESWIENYSQYINHKRNNQADKIDFALLEVLQEESKKIIVNLSLELGILTRDLELNKNWISTAKMLLERSENLNNIDKILLSKENEENLEKIYTQLVNNQVAIQDKNLADLVKSLQWAIRARSLLRSIEINPSTKLNYRIAFRTSQEANSLKYFYEIKKKDYYTCLMTQVTLAKNIRDISEILKNSASAIASHLPNSSNSMLHHQTNLKQVTEEQFEKIVKDFLNKCHVDLPEEREIVESFIKLKSQYEKKFENFVTLKINLSEYEKLLTDLKKFPIHLERLIREIDLILYENKIILRDVRKIFEQFNKTGTNSTMLLKDKIQQIYERYKNSKASFVEGDQLARMYETSEDKIKKLKSALIPSANSISPDIALDIYDLINLMDSIEVHNPTEEKILLRKLWKRKFDSFVENSCEFSSPSFSHIRNLVIEANELNILNHAEDNYKTEYNKLLDICEKSQEVIKDIFSTRSLAELSEVKNKISSENSCIDFGDYIIEQETRLGLNKVLPQVQVNKNLQNLFLGIKRKSDEQFNTGENARNKKSTGFSERHVKESIRESMISQLLLAEENYPKENENEISNLKENKEQNSLANSNLPISQAGIGNTRSKRKVNLKLDKDYLYDKEFIENFENKIAKRLKKSTQYDIENEPQEDIIEVAGNLQDEEYINDDNELEKIPIQSDTTKYKNKNLLSHISSEQTPTVTTSSKANLIKHLIKKNPTNDMHVNTYTVSNSQVDRDSIASSSISLRQLSIQSLTKILNENPTFSKEGDEYITKLSAELEEELFKSYNKLDRFYTNGFENMSKTVKELEKYKRVSILVTKGKLSLPKVAKFPYGEKYFEKLKKIDESVQSQISQKNKKKIAENDTSLNLPINSDTRTVECAKQETNLVSMISDIDKLYSSLNRSGKTESKAANKSTSVTELLTEIDDENNRNDDDNNSLKSLSDKDHVRFSPDRGHFIKSGSNLITSATAKSSNVQSPSSPIIFKKEISTISTFENIYNPFDIEDEEKENYFEFDLNVINVKSAKSSNSLKKNLIQPIFYDPFKNSDSINRSASARSSIISSPLMNLNTKKKSANNFDSIFQIWKGNLKINKLTLDNITMLSTNAPEIFTSIQNLPEEINISSKAKTKEVIAYIERYLGNKSEKISYGWFEIENEDEIESYQALADDYDKNDRSGFHSFNDIKYYIFTLSKRYSKFYKKMKNEFRIYNKSLMNHIDKLIVFVMIRKNESSENISEENYIYRENCIRPMILLTLVNKVQSETIVKQEEKKSYLAASIAEDNKMSPITSDEEDNKGDDAEDFTNFGNEKYIQANNAQYTGSHSNDYLQELLSGDDLEKLEEYVNTQFANLSQDEIIQKLISLDENSRAKLLNLIMEYQQRISNSLGGGNIERNENEEIRVDEKEIIEEDIENKDPTHAMDIDDVNERYQEVSANTRKNDHLSYLGFNNSNANADLLKKEILKNQGQANRNAEAMINEDFLKKNMNANLENQANTGVPNSQLAMNQMQYMNMNYPMVNMNQAYMVNPSYPQNMNYHQMNVSRPNMQMMMQRGGQNYNGMMPQNMSNIPSQAQAAYNMNLYNQRNMNNQSNNNNLNNKRDN